MVILENQTDMINYNCLCNNLALFCYENKKEFYPSKSCEKNDICIPKCCPLGQVFNVDHMHCDITTPAYFYKPEVFKSQNQTAHQIPLSTLNRTMSFQYFTLSEMQLKLCPRDHDFFYPSTNVHFLSDGNLFVDDGEVVNIYSQNFCIDNFYIHSENEPFVSAFVCNNISPLHTYHHSNLNQSFLKKKAHFKGCSVALTDLHHFDQSIRLVYSICGVIGEIFILITLTFYLSVPKLKNYQGKIVIANLISIFVATGLLVSHYFFYKVCLVIRNAIM